jgi:hypothetical protein
MDPSDSKEGIVDSNFQDNLTIIPKSSKDGFVNFLHFPSAGWIWAGRNTEFLLQESGIHPIVLPGRNAHNVRRRFGSY